MFLKLIVHKQLTKYFSLYLRRPQTLKRAKDKASYSLFVNSRSVTERFVLFSIYFSIALFCLLNGNFDLITFKENEMVETCYVWLYRLYDDKR